MPASFSHVHVHPARVACNESDTLQFHFPMAPLSDLPVLLDHLKRHGLQALAPRLVTLGVRSLSEIEPKQQSLLAAGLLPWQIEVLMSSTPPGESQLADLHSGRSRFDLPVNRAGGHASLSAALTAAEPRHQSESLAALHQDILAPSTRPSVVSRVATWRAICEAWGVPSFPMAPDNIKKVAASLKRGHYRSAKQYFSVVASYQRRELGVELPPYLRSLIRDACRSIERGLGPAVLKDAFCLFHVQALVRQDNLTAFSAECAAHTVDVVILGSWFMLRELELAQAEYHHLQVHGRTVSLAVPFQKTCSRGDMCQRALDCACADDLAPLCPFHAACRHIHRVRAANTFQGPRGGVLAKAETIKMIRSTLAACGIPWMRTLPDGAESQRFHGHALRVSGAQFCAAAGLTIDFIQAHGRWKSCAIQRYLQSASLAATPSMARRALQTDIAAGVCAQPLALPCEASHDKCGPPAKRQKLSPDLSQDAQRNDELQRQYMALRADLDSLKLAMVRPPITFVARNRSRVAHRIGVPEHCNTPAAWKTSCGWHYGLTSFHRFPAIEGSLIRCKKCFSLSEQTVSDDEQCGSSSDSSSASSFSEEPEGVS